MSREKGETFGELFESQKAAARRPVRLDMGAELDVVVVQVGRDAVFVDLDEKQQGFIDAKDLVNKRGELTVKEGSRIRARVVELGGTVRLAPLLVRPAEGDDESAATPAGAVESDAVVVGARVRGVVSAVERYGVFLKIGPGQPRGPRGLVPLNELGVPRGADLHKLFPLGKELDAKVVAIDEQGKIRLSIVQLAADDERKAFEAYEERSKQGGPTVSKQFGTLGDLLAGRKKR